MEERTEEIVISFAGNITDYAALTFIGKTPSRTNHYKISWRDQDIKRKEKQYQQRKKKAKRQERFIETKVIKDYIAYSKK